MRVIVGIVAGILCFILECAEIGSNAPGEVVFICLIVAIIIGLVAAAIFSYNFYEPELSPEQQELIDRIKNLNNSNKE